MNPSHPSNVYLGARVMVYYVAQGINDAGVINYLDSNWVELVRDNGDRLLIPTTSIRILKLVEYARNDGASTVLLRSVNQHQDGSDD